MNETTGSPRADDGARDPAPSVAARSPKWPSVALLVVCSVLALGVWFAGAAVQPILSEQYAVGAALAGLSTASVGLGCVAGTLASAILGLADRLDPRRFFMSCRLAAALANGATAFLDPGGWAPIGLRSCVGAAMAGVYRVGMKMVSSWSDRGSPIMWRASASTTRTGGGSRR